MWSFPSDGSFTVHDPVKLKVKTHESQLTDLHLKT